MLQSKCRRLANLESKYRVVVVASERESNFDGVVRYIRVYWWGWLVEGKLWSWKIFQLVMISKSQPEMHYYYCQMHQKSDANVSTNVFRLSFHLMAKLFALYVSIVRVHIL